MGECLYSEHCKHTVASEAEITTLGSTRVMLTRSSKICCFCGERFIENGIRYLRDDVPKVSIDVEKHGPYITWEAE